MGLFKINPLTLPGLPEKTALVVTTPFPESVKLILVKLDVTDGVGAEVL